jgi:Tfp pilus assembly protein FimV
MVFDRFIKLMCTLISVTLALLLLPAAQAVSIGEVFVQSRWGEPLRAQVELRANEGELIEESCLALMQPDAQEEDALAYLTRAMLGIKRDNGRQLVTIRTTQPFKEMFAKLRLRIKCADNGGATKVLTILPDLDTDEVASDQADQVAEVKYQNNKPTELVVGAESVAQSTNSQIAKNPPSVVKPVALAHKNILPPRKKINKDNGPSLKLSTGKIDDVQLAQVAGHDNNALMAKLQAMNTDDQIAAMLAMQHEIEQLREEMSQLKLKLHPPIPAVAPARVVPAPVEPPMEYGLALWLGGISVSLLIGLLGLRYVKRNKANANSLERDAAEDDTEWDAPVAQALAPALSTQPANSVESDSSELAEKITAPKVGQGGFSEADLMMEEAQLYAAHNRPQKAIEILNELIESHPEKMDAWLALFTHYAALNDGDRFEQLAQRFQDVGLDAHTWKLVQALGRTLDRSNALYLESDSNIAHMVSTEDEKLNLINQTVIPKVSPVIVDENTEPPKVDLEVSAPLVDAPMVDRFKPLEFDLNLNSDSKLNTPPNK